MFNRKATEDSRKVPGRRAALARTQEQRITAVAKARIAVARARTRAVTRARTRAVTRARTSKNNSRYKSKNNSRYKSKNKRGILSPMLPEGYGRFTEGFAGRTFVATPW